ncbi:hypothetical protein M0R45_011312 [Rubus argutus]
MELDRVSNLPSDVTEKILSHLPIRDAVRTSVLSSKWRYKSAMLPHLVFDCTCTPTANYTVENIVDHVLLSHIGSIHKFKLAQGDLSFRDIDRFDTFKLRNCMLAPPSTFKGFKSLRSLAIEDVSLSQDVLESMISSSQLESLTLKNCNGFRHLKIDAPNLQALFFFGVLEEIEILNTLNLVDGYICLQDVILSRGPCTSSNVLKFFGNMPLIQRLSIRGDFTKYLATSALLEKLPKPCLHLQFLTISICFNDVEDILTILCLLGSSPALEEVEIWAHRGRHYQTVAGKVNSWVDGKNNQSCSFTRLQHVKIHSFPAVEAALDFVKFLVLNSPALETMTLYHYKDGSDLARKLLRFRRASANLEIILI